MGHPHSSVTTPSAPPIFQTTAFDVPDLDVLESVYSGAAHGDIYTRDSNPNHAALAESIAALEGAEQGAVFASGMGAIASVFLSLCSSGDHVVIARSVYGKTLQLVDRLRKQFALEVGWFDIRNPSGLKSLLTAKTRFVFAETISNPLLDVADVAALAGELPESVPLVIDATFTTPELSQPCLDGASLVVHSGSKYLNGHGDVMLGLAAGRKSLVKRMSETSSIFGQNANPFESWLCQRGLRTLSLRMREICRTTWQLADFFAGHPRIRRVHFPLLSNHSSSAAASRLYPQGTGGIVSIELDGCGFDVVNRFMRAASHLPFSPTLADARTTVSHPATTSHRFLSEEARHAMGITPELVRVSVGLEPFEMLRDEFDEALRAL